MCPREQPAGRRNVFLRGYAKSARMSTWQSYRCRDRPLRSGRRVRAVCARHGAAEEALLVDEHAQTAAAKPHPAMHLKPPVRVDHHLAQRHLGARRQPPVAVVLWLGDVLGRGCRPGSGTSWAEARAEELQLRTVGRAGLAAHDRRERPAARAVSVSRKKEEDKGVRDGSRSGRAAAMVAARPARREVEIRPIARAAVVADARAARVLGLQSGARAS